MAKAPRSLAGKIVAITGGARGIGKATARALIAQGARVAIGDIDSSLASQTAAELGSGTVALPLDVTDRASFQSFVTEVESRLGPLDVLINNAGIMPVGPFVSESDATTDRMIDINLRGVIFGSKLALERFLPRGRGHLVNVASVAGKGGFPGGATYCATKHAVVGLSEAIRAEVRKTDIDVSIVMPVGVNTELYSGIGTARTIGLAEPEDVANAIVEALQTGRVDVFVPKRLNGMFRSLNMLPRRAADFVAKVLGTDNLLANPDHVLRSAYEQRTAGPAAGAVPQQAPGTAVPNGGESTTAADSPESETKEPAEANA